MSNAPEVSVLLIARAPDAAPPRPELAELLGGEAYVRLERVLLERAGRWARGVAPGRVQAGYEPADARGSVEAALGDEVTTFPLKGDGPSDQLRAAVARVFGERPGPLLVAWPDLWQWRPVHADGALGDLRAGCDVAVGPVFDGGFYLIALARPVPTLLELPDDVWAGPEAMGGVLAAAHRAGLTVGLLRAERGLRRADDVAAALADPLLDGELATILHR